MGHPEVPDGYLPDPGESGDRFQWSRSDFALLRRAARAQWGVPDDLKTEALWQAAKIVADPDESPETIRLKVAVLRFLVAVDRADIAGAKLELERALKVPPPEPPDTRPPRILIPGADERVNA